MNMNMAECIVCLEEVDSYFANAFFCRCKGLNLFGQHTTLQLDRIPSETQQGGESQFCFPTFEKSLN